MRFIVVGASSFSGKAFLEYLRAIGAHAVGLSRPHCDLNTEAGRAMVVDTVIAEQADYVVNFAALNMVAESWKYAADYYRTNVIGVTELAESLRRRVPGLKKFVQVSTPEVYGNTEDVLTPGAPYRPSTPYAVSRAAADMHLEAMHAAYRFPVCFTRTVNVYGPGQQPYRIIPKTVLKILRGERLKLHGGGMSTRSFIHIKDVAAAISLVAERGVPGEVYHAATPVQTSIRSLVHKVCDIMGEKFDDVVTDDHERLGKDRAYQLDYSKTMDALSWRPLIYIGHGLKGAVLWFEEHAADYAADSLEYEHRP